MTSAIITSNFELHELLSRGVQQFRGFCFVFVFVFLPHSLCIVGKARDFLELKNKHKPIDILWIVTTRACGRPRRAGLLDSFANRDCGYNPPLFARHTHSLQLSYLSSLIDDLRKSRGLHSVTAYRHGLYIYSSMPAGVAQSSHALVGGTLSTWAR